jgi:glycosyltransferase involved in cell wall biosynthesis
VIAQLVIGLAARHEVGLLHLRGLGDDVPEEALVKACTFVESVPRPHRAGVRRKAHIGGWIAQRKPVWVAEWWSPEFARRLRSIAADWDPDVVQIEFHVMAQYIQALGACVAPRVLTEHEAGVLAAGEERRFRGLAARLALSLDQRAWRGYERTILSRIDSVAVFSERDRAALTALGASTEIRRIPLGVAIPTTPLAAPETGASVLFVGNFRHRPNIDAAIRLVRDIHPRVRAKHPGARLYIVGDGAPKRLAELANDEVVITGKVPDVAPYLRLATVVAAPVRFGGGVRVKVLEAMAAGRPVVASPVAAAAIAVDHLVLADTDDQFAQAIIELLQQPERCAELGARGRRWVEEHASAELMVDALDEIHDSVLTGRVLAEV